MRRLLLALLVATAVTGTGSAQAASACGTVRGDDGKRYRVAVERGPLGCPSARRVFVDLFAGRGIMRQGEQFSRVGKWRCGFNMGAFACRHQGARHQEISATPVKS